MDASGSQSGGLDGLDTALLDDMQAGVPIEPDPWSGLGLRRRLGGPEVLERVRRLKQRRLIREISAIYDTTALGYRSVLVAGRVAPERLESAAAVISGDPGVSHNYQREAEFNLWFTLAVPPGQSLPAHLERLSRAAGLEGCHALPATRVFHIGVRLDVGGDKDATAAGRTQGTSRRVATEGDDAGAALAPPAWSEQDKRIIRASQIDLPLQPRPFDPICAAAGVPFEQFRAWMEEQRRAGVLRRYAAVLRHREAGFSANGMGVWRAPEAVIEEAGRLASQFEAVSHCYQRPSFPDWPYNLYTMVHARNEADCRAVIARIAERLAPLGIDEHRVLFSTREFKKARVRYFTES